MQIGKIIAHNLKRIREERNLSQGQLAELAGVSKVVISQIEKGDSNPTINTIWKLTGALNLPYASLLEMEQIKTVHIKKSELSEQIEGDFHIFNYYQKNPERNFEVYQVELDGGSEHSSIGHCANSYEYVMMLEGDAVIIINERSYHLEKDDTLYFDASVPHQYVNNEDCKVKMMVLIQYHS